MKRPTHPPACAFAVKRARLRNRIGVGDDHRVHPWPRIINRGNPVKIGLNQRNTRRPPCRKIGSIFRKRFGERRLRCKRLGEDCETKT